MAEEKKKFDMGYAAKLVRQELKQRGKKDNIIFPFGRLMEDGSIRIGYWVDKPFSLVTVYPDGRMDFEEDEHDKQNMDRLIFENRLLKLQIENIQLRNKLYRLSGENSKQD